MAETLKEIIENYEKLHRLHMIETVISKIQSYVYCVIQRVDEEFDEYENFEDEVTDSVIKYVKENLTILDKYLNSNDEDKNLKR